MKALKIIVILFMALTATTLFAQDGVNSTAKAAKTNATKEIQPKTENEKVVQVASSEVKQNKGTLLFFLNPNGYPCQQQDKIIKQSMPTISGMADVNYIATTDAMSRFTFNRYGVRRLPSLILLDANGDISKSFPPGIRSKDEILTALKSL